MGVFIECAILQFLGDSDMVIGFNLIYLQPGIVGGTETYARELIREFSKLHDHKIIIFCNLETVSTFEKSENIVIVQVTDKPFSQVDRLMNENLFLNKILSKYPVDVLFSPSGIAAPLLLKNIPQVCTAHDLQHLHLKHNFSFARRVARTFLYAASYWRCKHIIAISDFTRMDVIRHFGVQPSLITTIHHGVSDEPVYIDNKEISLVRQKFNLSGKFFYYPAAMHRHKNHLVLLEHFAEAKKSITGKVDLVFTGSKSEMFPIIQEQIKKLNLIDSVHYFGYISRNEVFALMTMSEAVVFPSAFEGFGLPLLEAMKCGVPVIASNKASLPEIAGNAAILLDPYDRQGWKNAMITLLENQNMKANLIEQGYANVKRFSWKKCAEETLQILQDAVR